MGTVLLRLRGEGLLVTLQQIEICVCIGVLVEFESYGPLVRNSFSFIADL